MWVREDYFEIAKENGCCTSWRTLRPPTSAGMKRMPGSACFTAWPNSSCDRLEHLERVHLGASGRVDDELGEHLALDARLPEDVRVARRRATGDAPAPASPPGSRRTAGRCWHQLGLASLDSLRDTARGPLTREVRFVGDLLGQVDVGEHVGDVDGGRQAPGTPSAAAEPRPHRWWRRRRFVPSAGGARSFFTSTKSTFSCLGFSNCSAACSSATTTTVISACSTNESERTARTPLLLALRLDQVDEHNPRPSGHVGRTASGM